MSVKDQLEQSHVDGSHTTVKSKRSTNTGVVSQFNKEAAWQVQQYGDYAGAIILPSSTVLYACMLLGLRGVLFWLCCLVLSLSFLCLRQPIFSIFS